jgi:hypothetical protein
MLLTCCHRVRSTLLSSHNINAQVESPIFQDLPRVPAPLGTFVHTSALFRNLPLGDRASALPLLKPLLEHDVDEAIYRCVCLFRTNFFSSSFLRNVAQCSDMFLPASGLFVCMVQPPLVLADANLAQEQGLPLLRSQRAWRLPPWVFSRAHHAGA